MSSERLVARMHELGVSSARYAPSEARADGGTLGDARPGDLMITIGAGNVWKIGEALAKELGVRR